MISEEKKLIIKQITEMQKEKEYIFNEFIKPLSYNMLSKMELQQLGVELERLQLR